MKPDREGVYSYRQYSVMVMEGGIGGLTFTALGEKKYVKDTTDSDWGAEILPPCEHRQQVCNFGRTRKNCDLERDGRCRNK